MVSTPCAAEATDVVLVAMRGSPTNPMISSDGTSDRPEPSKAPIRTPVNRARARVQDSLRLGEAKWNVLIGLVLSVLAWTSSPASLFVARGFPGSWQTPLEMAAHGGIAFGTRIVFTYGPL